MWRNEKRQPPAAGALWGAVIALLCVFALGLTQCGPSSVIYGKSPDIDLGQKSAAPAGSGWRYDEETDTFYIENGASVRIKSSTTSSRIVIERDASAVLTLQNVFIDLSLTGWACPILLEDGASVEIRLEGTNMLYAGDEMAGIQTDPGSALVITSAAGDGETSGTIYAEGGQYGAGIGSGSDNPCGKIIITGGMVDVTGGELAAGLGGGHDGSGGTIDIMGGTVTARSGPGAAGIGGGLFGDGGDIRFSGGSVTATATPSAGYGTGYPVGPGDGFYAEHPDAPGGTFNGQMYNWPEATEADGLTYKWP
jgi:hypothetical protein